MATPKILSDGGPDGVKLGQSASDLIALYGGTAASQRASSVQATSLISAYTATSASALIGALLARAMAGQVLVEGGQVGDWMLLLLSGTVDVTRRIGEGDEVARLAVIRAGAAVGEMSMPIHWRPRFWAATRAVPQPQKASRTMSLGLLLALMMRSSRARGFCVG